jgi:hypothetical protein
VSGAAVGAGAAIYVGRENQRARARTELARTFGAYLAAVDTLVSEYRRRPWQPAQTRLKKLRRGGPLSRLLHRRLWWRDVEFLQRVEGDRAHRVWDQYWHAAANLRVHAEPALLELVDEADEMLRRWREDRPETTEWPPLRERMLSAYRGRSMSAAG